MMPETVRLVSDGEELVLSAGEAFRIRPRLAIRGAVAEHTSDVAKRVAIRYVGFQDVQNRREYALRARRGDQEGFYTVSIELADFADRKALLQDGPDICYQKLLLELGDSEPHGDLALAVTPGDLAAYREAHSVPKRSRAARPEQPPRD